MPQNAKNSHRPELAAGTAGAASKKVGTHTGLSDMNGTQTEEERINAIYKLSADQWAQQQQEMAK